MFEGKTKTQIIRHMCRKKIKVEIGMYSLAQTDNFKAAYFTVFRLVYQYQKIG